MRKALIPENRFGRYFFYAIGEIVLVVIGILIALQINNWNHTRQERNIVQEYLEIIKTNIDTDLNNMEIIIDHRKQALLYTDTIMNYYKNEYISDPKLFELGFMSLFIEQWFFPNTSAYESLKNSGFLRTVGNTKIEEGLNSYYSFIDQILIYEEVFNSLTLPVEEKLSENGFYIEYQEMFQWNHQDTIFFTYEDLKIYPDVQATFIRAKMWLESFVSRYPEFLIIGNELLDILENGDE